MVLPVAHDHDRMIIEHFDGLLQQMIVGRTQKACVWHYTDGDGVVGIIENKKLWAFHIAFMNDSEEYFGALAFFKDMINERRKTMKLSGSEIRILSAAEININDASTKNMHHWFVSSFSLVEDNLALWRGYSTSGPKFSIGFGIEHLAMMSLGLRSKTQDNGLYMFNSFLVPAIYDTREKSEIVRKMIDFILERYAIAETTDRPVDQCAYAKEWFDRYGEFASVIAASFKSCKFCEESEWRLLVRPQSHDLVRFRSRGGILRPYVEVDLEAGYLTPDCSIEKNPIRELYVGPSRYSGLNEVAVDALIKKHRFSVSAKNSSVPLREM